MQEKDAFIDLFSQYGWKIKTGKEQKYGSVADIYAVNENCFMWVDDGDVSPIDTVYHIYSGLNDLDGKIFEGRIETKEEFTVIMKVLGFVKIGSK